MMSFHISKLPVVPICVIGIHPRDQETSAARRQGPRSGPIRGRRARRGGGPCAAKGAITPRERNLNSLPNIWISSSSRKHFISPRVRKEALVSFRCQVEVNFSRQRGVRPARKRSVFIFFYLYGSQGAELN